MIQRILIIILSTILFWSCDEDRKKNLELSDQFTQYIQVDSLTTQSEEHQIKKYIQPYKAKVDSVMEEQIGLAEVEFFKNQPNGNLNNLAADMIFEIAKELSKNTKFQPDLCLLNYGGLRYPIAKGKITLASIYQLMPFENEIVIIQLNGYQVDSLFQYIASSNGQPIAGSKVFIKDQKYIKAQIGNIPFDKTKTYNIATSDYLADGGDKMLFLKNPIAIYKTGMLIRNGMIKYIKDKTENGEIIKADKEDRIITIK